MIQINYHRPIKLEDAVFDVRLKRDKTALPSDIQERVDARFQKQIEDEEVRGRKRPTRVRLAFFQNTKSYLMD